MYRNVKDQRSTYYKLLEKCNYETMLIRRIKVIAMTIFTSSHDLNPIFVKKMYNIKELAYALRDSHIVYKPL